MNFFRVYTYFLGSTAIDCASGLFLKNADNNDLNPSLLSLRIPRDTSGLKVRNRELEAAVEARV